MTNAVINTKELVGNTLDTRDEAQKLFAYLEEHDALPVTAVFDFEDTIFMSRSFADEFHKLKMKRLQENNDAVVEIVNAPVQVIEILQAVAKTQKSRTLHNSDRIQLSFTNCEQLTDFLLSV
jgi:hypothetical protein